MAQFMVHGVPMSLARDGWWFEEPKPKAIAAERGGAKAGWALLGLLLTGDFLFWHQAGPGISLALFLFAVGLVLRGLAARGLAVRGFGAGVRRDWGLVVLLMAVLPLVERVQVLSVVFGVLGLLGYAVWLQAGRVGLILGRFPALLAVFPSGLTDAVHAVSQARRQALANGATMRGVRALALPIGLGMCFAGLLVAANPVLAEWLGGRALPNPARGLFWAGLALMLWPVLQVPRADLASTQVHLPRWGFGGLINAGAVRTSLWLFNAMFAVQTVMDARYLWGGADLPAGMSHAEYAHRGAYPLLFTALLAGLFALVFKAYAAESKVVRALLLAWIVQTVALVISAILRLQTYVEAYGLTYLRLDAGIWMAVVAVGLAILAWAVLRQESNGWLALRCGMLGVGVLYGCCFVNFAGVIAQNNLAAHGVALDLVYLCDLGADAWAEMRRYRVDGLCGSVYGTSDGVDFGIDLEAPRIEGWRDWSYRSARILGQADAYSDRGR